MRIAMTQSAREASCQVDDFCKSENVVVISKVNEGARQYLELPFYCNLVSYGNNVVASVDVDIADFVKEYVDSYPSEHCFETPHMQVLNAELKKRGMGICFMAEYFLPDRDLLSEKPSDYRIQVLTQAELVELYLPQWSNALCEKRKHLDKLAVAAYNGDEMIGLAGCSADCASMWQIGVDVLHKYRKEKRA